MIWEKWDGLRRPPKSSLEFEQREHKKNEENSNFRCRSGSNVFYFKRSLLRSSVSKMDPCKVFHFEILTRTRAGMKKIEEWKNRANSIFRVSHRSDQGFLDSISIRGPERLIFQWGSFKGIYFQKESSKAINFKWMPFHCNKVTYFNMSSTILWSIAEER